MVLFFYNLLLMAALIVFGPLLFVKVILTAKYRRRFAGRLGFWRVPPVCGAGAGSPRIWLHALSVGEVVSARGLVVALRADFPQATLIFSSTTRAGERLARESLAASVDCFVPFPFDLLPSVRRFLSLLAPDLFILVETDFWPNFLAELKRRGIPALLVNGRVSHDSFRRYRSFASLFVPMFSSFSYLAMQTRADAEAMARLGLEAERLPVLGNLKYDGACFTHRPEPAASGLLRSEFSIPDSALVWVVGSSHAGEEESIFACFARLRESFPELFLVLAPRNIERGEELAALATRYALATRRRSQSVLGGPPVSVLILDTLGELARVYALADLVFVGGSLVPERGHNPLEPAACGKPVLFGPFMEDFAEISRDLLAAGGARQIAGPEELLPVISSLLASPDDRVRIGAKARELVLAGCGVVDRYRALIRRVLIEEGRG